MFAIIVILLLISSSPLSSLVVNLSFAQKIEVATSETPPKGKIVFVSSAGNIHIINPNGTNEIRLTEGYAPVWSPDEKKLAYITGSSLYIINIDGTNKTKVASDITGIDTSFANPWANKHLYAWSPDGKKLVFGKWKQPGIYAVKNDGSDLVKICDNETIGLTFSPDGKKIAFWAKKIIDYT